MKQAYIVNGVRTAIGSFGGALSTVRTDDLAAFVLKELMAKNNGVDFSQVGDVIMGCANQAGEDNRNVARMALLLAGLPFTVPSQPNEGSFGGKLFLSNITSPHLLNILKYFPDASYELIPLTTEQINAAAARPLQGGLKNKKFMSEYPDFRFNTVDDYVSYKSILTEED